MNYLILNDKDFFNDINIYNFKEVGIHDKGRVDGVFAGITSELLDKFNKQSGTGDSIFQESWLFRDRGVKFILLRIPQDILYYKDGKIIKKCFELFDKESFYIELGSIGVKNKEKSYEYFILATNKNSDFQIIFDKELVEKENILNYVLKKIEEKIIN